MVSQSQFRAESSYWRVRGRERELKASKSIIEQGEYKSEKA